jgi:fructose-1-phosphate kinase PfkB-like protein
MPFLTVCLNPTLQKTLCYPSIAFDAVNRTSVHRVDASGKGINVTRVLSQLGKKVTHLTHLGGDFRPFFLSLCEQDRLSVEWVESGSQIRFCYTVLTEDDGGVTEFVEEGQPVKEGTEELLLNKFDSLIERNFTWLIISGTKAAGYSDNVVPYMVRKAKEKGLGVILDVKGKDLTESLQYRPDVVKPNLYEFASTFAPDLLIGGALPDKYSVITDRIRPLMEEMVAKYGCRVILTNGSRAALVACQDYYFEIKYDSVKAVNSIGCGDAFTAGLAAYMETSFPKDYEDFKEAVSEGCRCGALNAGLLRPGVIK